MCWVFRKRLEYSHSSLRAWWKWDTPTIMLSSLLSERLRFVVQELACWMYSAYVSAVPCRGSRWSYIIHFLTVVLADEHGKSIDFILFIYWSKVPGLSQYTSWKLIDENCDCWPSHYYLMITWYVTCSRKTMTNKCISIQYRKLSHLRARHYYWRNRWDWREEDHELGLPVVWDDGIHCSNWTEFWDGWCELTCTSIPEVEAPKWTTDLHRQHETKHITQLHHDRYLSRTWLEFQCQT